MEVRIEDIIRETDKMNERINEIQAELKSSYKSMSRLFDAFQTFEGLQMYQPEHEYQLQKGVHVIPLEITEENVVLSITMDPCAALDKKVFDCKMSGRISQGSVLVDGVMLGENDSFIISEFKLFSIVAIERSIIIIHAVKSH